MRVERSALPLLFYRRLAVIGVGAIAVAAILTTQLTRLAVVQGDALRARAERVLSRSEFLPTWRGRVLDRNGLVLAQDRPSWSVSVPFPVLSGAWAIEMARREAIRADDPVAWRDLSPAERTERILAHADEWDGIVDALWDELAAASDLSRAEIDDRVNAIRRMVGERAEAVWDRQRRAHEERVAEQPGLAGPFRKRPIEEQVEPHPILTAVPDEVAFRMRRFAAEVADIVQSRFGERAAARAILELSDGRRRELPHEVATVAIDRSHLPRPLRAESSLDVPVRGIADHIIGDVRDEVWTSDVARRPFRDAAGGVVDLAGYRSGTDLIGARGIELAFEDRLRGALGRRRSNLETGEVRIDDPAPGDDVHLTIDVRLQARITALLDPAVGLTRVQQFHAGWRRGEPVPTDLPLGMPLNASAVVVDTDTGEILAMVGSPSLAVANEMSIADRRTHDPFVHRPVEGVYPPGSIVKPLVYLHAVTRGVAAVDEAVECTGHFFPRSPNFARCWIYRTTNNVVTHTSQLGHALGPVEAISRSCNIYFFEMARRLGADGMTDLYRGLGVGEPLDVGLLGETVLEGSGRRRVGEHGGMFNEATIQRLIKEGDPTAVINLGIGQGLVAWTPLHAATAYAALARGGSVVRPRLVRSGERVNPPSRIVHEFDWNPRALDRVFAGMRESVSEDWGTGHAVRYADGSRDPIFDVPGAIVWGKTGTAQSVPLRIYLDDDDEPDETIEGPDHSWYVALAGDERQGRPRYAIAVLLEFGGSGGRGSGPIVAEIVRALVEFGYLGGDDAAGGVG